jgi:hypothetical protein
MSEPRLEVRHINGRYWDVFTAEGERVARLDPGAGAQRLARLFAAAPGLHTAATATFEAVNRAYNATVMPGDRTEAISSLRAALDALLPVLCDLEQALCPHAEAYDGPEGVTCYRCGKVGVERAAPRPPCKVEGCGKPIAHEGNGQSCPYTCEEHAPGWGIEWGFCGWDGRCWRRAPRGATRCGLHGGRDYPPAEEPRCEVGCGEPAAPGSRYCAAPSLHHPDLLRRCTVRGCPDQATSGRYTCAEHGDEFGRAIPGTPLSAWLASRSPSAPRLRIVEQTVGGVTTPLDPPLAVDPARVAGEGRCAAQGCGAEAAPGAKLCRELLSHPSPGSPGALGVCLVRGCSGAPNGLFWLCLLHHQEYTQAESRFPGLLDWIARRFGGAPSPDAPPLPLPSEVTTHGAPAGEDTAALTEALQGAPDAYVTPEEAEAQRRPEIRIDITPMRLDTLEGTVERLRNSLWDTWEEIDALPKRCVAGDCGNIRRRGGALCTEHARGVR